MNTLIRTATIVGGIMIVIVIISLITPIFGWYPWGEAQNLFCGVGVLSVFGALLMGVGIIASEAKKHSPAGDDRFYPKK